MTMTSSETAAPVLSAPQRPRFMNVAKKEVTMFAVLLVLAGVTAILNPMFLGAEPNVGVAAGK